jgi:2-dehydropantoate 2-reductase
MLRTHSFGDYHFAPSGVYDSVASAKAANIPWHYVVVTPKALPDLSDDSALVEPVVTDDTAIVLIQNGVGVEAPYRARFPRTPILSGVTVVSAAQIEPGVVRQNRWTRLSMGPYNGESAPRDLVARSEERNSDLAKRLTAGGIKDVETYDEQGLQLVRWHKLVINVRP